MNNLVMRPVTMLRQLILRPPLPGESGRVPAPSLFAPGVIKSPHLVHPPQRGRAVTADRVSPIVAHFEQRILSGELAPGDTLPPERALCEAFDVGRSTVREAINRLASLGLVRSVHGSGTRVEAPSARPVAAGLERLIRRSEPDLAKLAQVRLPLETAMAALAALHRTDEHLARLERAQAELAAAGATLEAQVRADLDFHAVLAEASGNPFFGLMLSPIQGLLIQSRRLTLGEHGARLAHDHHAAILHAVRARDEQAAAEAMRRHLQTNAEHLSRAPTMRAGAHTEETT